MKKINLIYAMLLFGFSLSAQDQVNQSKLKKYKLCYKVYVVGLTSDEAAIKLKRQFKEQPGVYKTEHVFKSAEHKYTMLKLYTIQYEGIPTKIEEQSIRAVSRGTIKGILTKNELSSDKIEDERVTE